MIPKEPSIYGREYIRWQEEKSYGADRLTCTVHHIGVEQPLRNFLVRCIVYSLL